MNYRISEAAKKIGVHPSTLRDLEKRGVITIRRDWSGFRVFNEEEIQSIEKNLFYRKQGCRVLGVRNDG